MEIEMLPRIRRKSCILAYSVALDATIKANNVG